MIVVFGASGQVGTFLLPMLAARGETVTALSRVARADTGAVRWRLGTLPDAVPEIPPAPVLISLGPLDHFVTWLQRAPIAHAARVVALSSMSAESKQASPDHAERELAARLCDAEQRLAARCADLSCAWTVLRPTLIYGGTDGSLARYARRARRWRVFPLPAGKGLRQPVHAGDLANAVLAALDRPHSADRVLALGGGERLSAQEMFARVRAALPQCTLGLPIPRGPLGLCARFTPAARGAIARLDEDLTADNAEAEALLGVHPRGFAPGSR